MIEQPLTPWEQTLLEGNEDEVWDEFVKEGGRKSHERSQELLTLGDNLANRRPPQDMINIVLRELAEDAEETEQTEEDIIQGLQATVKRNIASVIERISLLDSPNQEG